MEISGAYSWIVWSLPKRGMGTRDQNTVEYTPRVNALSQFSTVTLPPYTIIT